MFWREGIGRFRCNRPNRIWVSIRNADYISLPFTWFCQNIGICVYLMLYWAFSIRDIFGFILKMQLQLARVFVCEVKVSEKIKYLVGIGIWWSRGRWDNFLDDSSCKHLPFLGWNLKGKICWSLSSFGSRLEQVWLSSHYHFYHCWRSLAEEHIRGHGKKVEWLPIASYRFWTILLLHSGWAELIK